MAAVRGPAAGTPWLDRLFPWLLGLVSVAVVLAEDKGGARTLSNSLSPLEGLAPVAPDPVTPSWLSGSWGPWSPWSECSRSCGTGVAVQTRECRRRVRAVNKKKDKKKHRKRSERSKHESDARRRKSRVLSTQCVGQYKRVHVCNEQECPRGSLDFRALQCEAHNKHNYSGHFYQWEPFLAAPDPCQLNCRAKGFRFYATLNQSVVDGTACLPKVTEPAPLLAARRSRWLCVSGICQRVGCDGVVGSSARLDGCGVCGGDNSTCRTVSGIFTRPQLPQGFNVIAVLPQGACNVTIAQLKPTINLLSVRRLGGSPVLHGGGRPSWPGVYEAAGTRFTYTQADPVRGVAETLSAPGPLSKPTELLLMYQQPNPGIKYEYSVPLPRREFGAAGAPPTALAAPLPPLLTTTPAPEERNDGDNEVADGFPFGQAGGQDVPAMDAADAPPKGGKGRRFMWKVTGYSECSKSCGGGVQEAQVHCVRHNSLLPVSPYRCAGQEKPYEFLVPKTCSTRPCPAEWVTGDWSGCSVTCGSGTQTREQSCRQEISTSLAVRVADGACLGARPEVTLLRACVQPPCHHHHHHHHHHVAPPRPPPPPQRDLQAAATPAPAASWSVGPWGQCSAECGRGVRSRTVSCPERPDGATCAPGEQPASQEACDAGPCASIASAPAGALSWLASEWSTHVMLRRVRHRRAVAVRGVLGGRLQVRPATPARPHPGLLVGGRLLPRPVVRVPLGAVLGDVRPGRADPRRGVPTVAARRGPPGGPRRRLLRPPAEAGAAAALRGAGVPPTLVRRGVERVLPVVRHGRPEEGGAVHRPRRAFDGVLGGRQAALQEGLPPAGLLVGAVPARDPGRPRRLGRPLRRPSAQLPPRGAGTPLQVLVLRVVLLQLLSTEGRLAVHRQRHQPTTHPAKENTMLQPGQNDLRMTSE